jgi:serpin B
VPTFIGLMKQVARIKLSEEGTEAAAVTVIGVNKTSVGGLSIVHFHANRPFLYVISERSSGAVFFIGQYYGD